MNTLLDLKLDIRGAPRAEGTRVATVVLAACASRRMGDRHKLLLDVGGEPMIRRTVRNALAFASVETVVVTGHRAPEVEAALAGLPVELVRNPFHEQGQPTSVAAGVRALTAPCDAVMIVLGDQPQVTAAHMRTLVEAWEKRNDDVILVPQHAGRRGNPIVFGVRYVPEVVSGVVNVGCRRLIETHPDNLARVEFDSDVYTTDCDTPEDYRQLLARMQAVP
jgi:molybdenum cofactor cytidylyltransferase